MGDTAPDAATDLGIDGVLVGHCTDPDARTGCTVVLFPKGTVASGEIRGGAPATREFDVLGVERMVDELHGLVLAGGSAFGLAAADGVMAYCVDQGVGFSTSSGRVPIVVAMSLFDLGVGNGLVRPTAADGRAAAIAAEHRFAVGAVGAGTGATMGKWGAKNPSPGGVVAATVRVGDLVVSALFAVNAAGHVDDGSIGPMIADGSFERWPESKPFENTTIGCVVTNATLTKTDCLLVAQGAHDGFARALFPPHLRSDGDAVVAAATGTLDASAVDVDVVRTAAVVATEQAIRQLPPTRPR